MTVLPISNVTSRVPHNRAASRLGSLDAKLAALTVFLSPMNYFRLDVVYLTLADAAACATLLVMLLKGNLPRAPFGMLTPLWLCGALAIVTGLTIGSIAQGDMQSLVVIVLQYVFSLVVIVFVLAGRTYRETVMLLKVFVLSIAVVMAYGAYVVHFVPDPDWRLVSASGRMRSLVERENAAATLGAIAMVLLLNLALMREISRWKVALLMPVLLYGILLTGSNTGLLLTTFGITVTALFSGSPRFLLGYVVLVAAAAATVIFAGDTILPDVFRERVLGALTTGDLSQAGTFEDRYYLIGEAVGIARDTLLIGLGADQYREISSHGVPVHNSYLLLLTEGGLLSFSGLILLLMTGITLAWASIALARAPTHGVIALTITLIYAVMLNTYAHFYARFWIVPLTLALALAASRLNMKPMSRP
ncbi:MAG: O-antigen ligase family protein [Pseudomonadota bacterium]